MATVVCPECGCHRSVTDRTARRIRAGQTAGTCRTCRTLSHVEIGEFERAWARRAWNRWSDEERGAVMLAFSPRLRD